MLGVSYPDWFKEKVKRVYPDRPDLHEMVENGDSSLGSCLDDSRYERLKSGRVSKKAEAEARQLWNDRTEVWEDWNAIVRGDSGEQP